MLSIIYKIPEESEIIFVSDFFVSDLVGGAELTYEAIIKKCPHNIFKIHSHSVTSDIIEKNSSKYWILGNIANLSKDNIINIATTVKRFSKIECDYLYCLYHSSHLHKLQTGNECDCHKQNQGRFVLGLYKRAEHVFFMSEGQLNEYKKLFPSMNSWSQNKLLVLSSVFDDKTLNYIEELYKKRQSNNGKWAIQSGGTWIKNQKEIEQYCKRNNVEYELIGGNLKPEEFLNKLSEYRGIIIMPAGFDTCPRISIEAKLLGLELILNENVQHKDESWFKTNDRNETIEYLKSRATFIWNII